MVDYSHKRLLATVKSVVEDTVEPELITGHTDR